MIYLDHAATTSVCPRAVAEMKKCLEIYYGNPSGAYEFAQQLSLIHIYFSISHGCCKVYSAYKNNLAGMPSFTMTLCCVKIIFYGIEIAREGK